MAVAVPWVSDDKRDAFSSTAGYTVNPEYDPGEAIDPESGNWIATSDKTFVVDGMDAEPSVGYVVDALPLEDPPGWSKGIQRTLRIRNLCSALTLVMFVGGLFGAIVCAVLALLGNLEWYPTGIASFIAVFAYIGHLAEAHCVSAERGYLNNIKTADQTHMHVHNVRSSMPTIRWNSQSYHYETRVHHETYTDSEGKQQRRTRHERVRVNTHHASKTYSFYSWRDLSQEPSEGIDKFPLVKVNFKKRFTFADEYTADKYHCQMRHFRYRHDRDTHQDFSVHFHVPGFKPHVLGKCVRAEASSCA